MTERIDREAAVECMYNGVEFRGDKQVERWIATSEGWVGGAPVRVAARFAAHRLAEAERVAKTAEAVADEYEGRSAYFDHPDHETLRTFAAGIRSGR